MAADASPAAHAQTASRTKDLHSIDMTQGYRSPADARAPIAERLLILAFRHPGCAAAGLRVK
jgi:hypothetical protein